jgi:hypothetical protein
MTCTSSQNHSITLEEASELTANFRSANPNAVKCHYFGKDAIQAILNQTACVGIRIYYGQDSNGNKQPVIVGVDEACNDLYQGLLAERGTPCPSNCSTTNPLNS